MEIEAKLDKVRHVTLLPSALCICRPGCLRSLLLFSAITSIKAACISHMLCTSTVRNTKKPKTNHPTYLEWNVFLSVWLFLCLSVDKCRPDVRLYLDTLTQTVVTGMFFCSTNCQMRSGQESWKAELLQVCLHWLCVSKSTISFKVKSETVILLYKKHTYPLHVLDAHVFPNFSVGCPGALQMAWGFFFQTKWYILKYWFW